MLLDHFQTTCGSGVLIQAYLPETSLNGKCGIGAESLAFFLNQKRWNQLK